MVEARTSAEALVEVEFRTRHRHGLPIEVMERSGLLTRKNVDELPTRQRVGFHVLYLVTSGTGVHHVDFDPVDMSPGTVLHLHPGQVQKFQLDPPFEALMVLWTPEFDPAGPQSPRWYPGSDVPTQWNLPPDDLASFVNWVEEIRALQDGFRGDQRQLVLLRCLLQALLLRLALQVPSDPDAGSPLPPAYVAFRELIEERLYERPTVTDLAGALGYSTRTLDRACQAATGKTAKAVLSERTALELRRLISHTDRPLTRIGMDFGFVDASNFSKFVRRHLGRVPSEVRDSG